MKNWRFKVVYFVLLPAIVIAAGVLGYFTYQTAVQLTQLGDKSIAHSILLLVKDRVDSIEKQIIAADEAVFGLINLANPDDANQTWAPQAPEISPSVRAVILLDAHQRLLGYAARASKKDKSRFLKTFQSKIVADLELERQPDYVLKHYHHVYDGQYYLISYKAVRFEGQRRYLIAHHDTGYLVRNVFPELFAGELAGHLYNVVNERNQRVFGQSLDHAGDYVVARRFPTTLYNWRLQIAPREAPLLKSKAQTTRYNQAALIGLSLAVILLGTLFILFAADKERRVNELKSEFIANVSHELKTPLSVIRMFGEMLLTGRVRDRQKQQQYVETICSESERLTVLIENVLDFAVLERGKRRYQMQPHDLFELVAHAIETCRYRFETEGAELRLNQDGEDTTVSVDEQAILLAVVNLVDNALKYGGLTAVQVTVKALPKEVQVLVRDHGPGIAHADLKRVFERFYRARRNSKARGAGIGLTLVKHIAEDHGGRAWAENASDGGAIVAFTVPRTKNGADQTPSPEQPEGNSVTPFQQSQPVERRAN